jgi:hypothetical protein
MAKDLNHVVKRINLAIRLHRADINRRIEHNRHGFTAAQIYAAMGETAAAAVQDQIAKADAAIVAIGEAEKAAALATAQAAPAAAQAAPATAQAAPATAQAAPAAAQAAPAAAQAAPAAAQAAPAAAS